MQRNSLVSIIAIAILVVAALIVTQGNLLTFAYTPSVSCGIQQSAQHLNTSGLCHALQIGNGGTITSLSQLTFTNLNSVNGIRFLINIVVNGQGQKLTGTVANVTQAVSQSTGQNYSATNLNSSVAISYGIVSESYYIPYYNTGYYIDEWGTSTKTLNYAPKYLGYGYTNCVGGYNVTSASYTLYCGGGILGGDLATNFFNNITAYASACKTQVGGILAINNPTGANQGWLGNSVNYTFQCLTPHGIPLASAIYSPIGTKYLNVNVSMTYYNGTSIKTTYLTNANYNATLSSGTYATIYGYTPSGSDILGSSLPIEVQQINQYGQVSNYIPISDSNYAAALANSYTGTGEFTSSIVGGEFTYTAEGATWTVPYAYFMGNVRQNINTTNNHIASFIQPISNSNFYYGQAQLNGGLSGLLIPLYNASGFNPALGALPYEPDIQLIGNVKSLGIYLPTPGVPSITDISPNPFNLKSGTTGTAYVTVQNIGQSASNFYVTINYNGGTFGSALGDAQLIPSGNVFTFEIPVTSPVLTANESIPLTSIACGIGVGAQCTSKTIQGTVSAECASEPYPVNPNTCQPIIPPKPICSGNQTAIYNPYNNTWDCHGTTPTKPPPPPIGIGWYILAGAGIIGGAYLFSRRSGAGKVKRSKGGLI